jgi:hypothetical protein
MRFKHLPCKIDECAFIQFSDSFFSAQTAIHTFKLIFSRVNLRFFRKTRK